MSTVPSSFLPTTTPYADGGWVSLSTSSRSVAMCSRASRRVYESFSLRAIAWDSCPLVSSSRSSSVRIRFGASANRVRRCSTSATSASICSCGFSATEAPLCCPRPTGGLVSEHTHASRFVRGTYCAPPTMTAEAPASTSIFDNRGNVPLVVERTSRFRRTGAGSSFHVIRRVISTGAERSTTNEETAYDHEGLDRPGSLHW